jgi:hypothetical protein
MFTMRLRPEKSEVILQAKRNPGIKNGNSESNLVFRKQIKQIHKLIFSFSENFSFHLSAFP